MMAFLVYANLRNREPRVTMQIAYQGEPGAFSEAAARRVGHGARRRSLRPGLARRLHPGLRRQHHALPRHRADAARGRRARQDVDRLLAAERSGVALQGAERVRAARDRSDEAGVAADSGPAVGVPLLRRPRHRARRGGVRARAGAPRRVRVDAADARHLSQLENARGTHARSVRGGLVSDRSNPLTTGPHRAPARAMLKAVGFTDADLKKPLIGVANTWIEIGPCNYHLRDLAAHVKEGIRAAGGTPMEFNTVSISDGITMGTEGMRASLVSREVIADSIELVTRGNGFDGLVVL